jgi:pectin methylesterase-like acyl-CoA thioesterase
MKKFLLPLFFLFLLGVFPEKTQAQTVDATTTITWPFNTGAAGQVATFSEGTAGYFNTNFVALGSNLSYLGTATAFSTTFTKLQPSAQLGSAGADGTASFCLRPKTGLTFTPTAISLDCIRLGTDGGRVNVIWKSTDGTLDTVVTNLTPNRNNTSYTTPSHVTCDLTSMGVPASGGVCSLSVYIYGLTNTKQIGLANIVIQGKIQGTIVNVITDTLTTTVAPAASGLVSVSPTGTFFDRGTDLILSASRNFGYLFSHWANAAGDTISNANPYSFKLNGNTNLIAAFSKINTYSLTMNVLGGAKDYMVSASPTGTTVEGKRMYEEGTSVTIRANNNPVLTFTNWASGATTSDQVLVMNADQEVTANYSTIDYIVGWDFWRTGNSGRVADFASSTENETATLILRDSSGTVKSWLDKSQIAAGGYEGAPAAVNWSPLTGHTYYQISFVAKDFLAIKVKAAMLFNYNAYSVQKVEYSLDGTNFTSFGKYTMSSAKVWYDSTFALPAAADHAERVYIRWIPDFTSSILGTSSTNDGTSISGIYVIATATILNDGVAPVLVSTLPANSATGVSASGKIILTFDEKVKIASGTTATLGGKTLIPAVSGKTITLPYTGLDYNTAYTFTLTGNTVSDLGDNTLSAPITFRLTTMARPIVTKKSFDFIVGVNGDFKAALTAATSASASGKRFHIFFPKGEYNIGTLTGDGNQMTTISIPNVSYIGESADSVVLYNKSTLESINSTATMYFTGVSSNLYMQDVSLKNKMDYRTGVLLGRGVALWDQGSKNIYKNVKLLSNQDTYYTGGDRSYLETCEIHGTVDFICGGGDIFFNECLLYLEDRSGNCITAPATNSNWGYVFNRCTIDGFESNNNSYRLGRPWSNAPKSVYLNTTMKTLPAATAWGDPMNVNPSVFAEYNSMNASGTLIDLSSRRSSYTKDGVTVNLNPVLTSQQAAQYAITNVVGGTDAWQPNLYTEQVSPPIISNTGTTLNWDDSPYVLCWAVCKNAAFVAFVTTNSYEIPSGTAAGSVFTVRAANEMGGLSIASNAFTYLSTNLSNEHRIGAKEVDKQYFSMDGRLLPTLTKGFNIVRTRFDDGRVSVSKIICNQDQ